MQHVHLQQTLNATPPERPIAPARSNATNNTATNTNIAAH